MAQKIKVSAEALIDLVKSATNQSRIRMGELVVVHNLRCKLGGNENPLSTIIEEIGDEDNYFNDEGTNNESVNQ